MNIPKTERPRIVIVGCGFAGLELAKGLKNKACQIVMIDRNNYHTFQPLLYQVATSGLEPDSIAHPIRKIFKNFNNFHFRMGNVLKVEDSKNSITTDIGELSYDYLVIATGTTTNFFGMKDVEKHAMTMKSITEALDLRSIILQSFEKALLVNGAERKAYMNFTIVGGGPTGVELAGALAELKNNILADDYPDLEISQMEINLIEMQEDLLCQMSNEASTKALKFSKELGVMVHLNESVEGYDGNILTFKNRKPINTKTLIWAAGVTGNLLDGINEEFIEKGRYEVDGYSKILKTKSIYAIGDIAFMKTSDYENGLPQVAPAAKQQGDLLAKNILKVLNGESKEKFKYFDKGSMATIGRNRAVVDVGKLKFQGLIAWFVWMFVHLMSLVGFRNRIITFFNWTYNYFSFDRGVRLIIRKLNR